MIYLVIAPSTIEGGCTLNMLAVSLDHRRRILLAVSEDRERRLSRRTRIASQKAALAKSHDTDRGCLIARPTAGKSKSTKKQQHLLQAVTSIMAHMRRTSGSTTSPSTFPGGGGVSLAPSPSPAWRQHERDRSARNRSPTLPGSSLNTCGIDRHQRHVL